LLGDILLATFKEYERSLEAIEFQKDRKIIEDVEEILQEAKG